jgi:predicted TIM-barrel fold metal-dependent hydrolase
LNPQEMISGLSRRRFLQAAATVTAGAALVATKGESADAAPVSLIDTNVSIGQWPFRHETLSDTADLVAKLREQGVSQAWAGSFDALLHKDISSVNARLVAECRRHGQGLLMPVGAVNPMLPDWKEDLRQCVEVHQMAAIRLHPNYHRYKLNDPIFEQVLQQAEERNLLVQISVLMEDERTVHPLVNVPATDISSLAEVLKPLGKIRVQLLNGLRTLRGDPLLKLAAAGVRFEIAMLEGVNGVANLLEKLPLDRLCFGSHAPFYYFEAAKLKLQESDLANVQMRAVCFENARRFLEGK